MLMACLHWPGWCKDWKMELKILLTRLLMLVLESKWAGKEQGHSGEQFWGFRI
jgi:hypothetical protein